MVIKPILIVEFPVTGGTAETRGSFRGGISGLGKEGNGLGGLGNGLSPVAVKVV